MPKIFVFAPDYRLKRSQSTSVLEKPSPVPRRKDSAASADVFFSKCLESSLQYDKATEQESATLLGTVAVQIAASESQSQSACGADSQQSSSLAISQDNTKAGTSDVPIFGGFKAVKDRYECGPLVFIFEMGKVSSTFWFSAFSAKFCSNAPFARSSSFPGANKLQQKKTVSLFFHI